MCSVERKSSPKKDSSIEDSSPLSTVQEDSSSPESESSDDKEDSMHELSSNSVSFSWILSIDLLGGNYAIGTTRYGFSPLDHPISSSLESPSSTLRQRPKRRIL